MKPLLVIVAAFAVATASASAEEALDSLLDGIDEPRAEEATAPGAPVVEPEVAPEPPPASSRRVEEIVVTAQRRSENIRDVPIAVSVMSGTELRDAGISSFNDLAALVPNVSFNTDFNSLYLRGIGTAELNVIGEQAVVYMLDDVYVSRIDYLKPGLMDLRQIEILKGPQGTLYGRNATGGVLKIDYGDPTDEWMTFVDLSAGERDRRSFEGALSGPLTETLSFRFAARLFDEDGHTRNLVDGSTLGDKDIQQFRGKLRYDVLPNLDVNVGVHRFDYFVGGWAGTEIFEYPDGQDEVIRALDPTFETTLDRRGSTNEATRSEGDGWLVPVKANWDVWDHTITSISAYAGLDDFQGGDLDGTGALLGGLIALVDSDQWSQEFRLTSPPGSIEYVGGVFLYESSLGATVDIPLAPSVRPGEIPGAETIGLLADLLGPVIPGPIDPTIALPASGEWFDNVRGTFRIGVESFGVFGQLKWSPFETLSLLAGGRFSRDSRDGRVTGVPEGPIWTALVLGGYEDSRHVVDTDFSPKFSILWDVLDAATAYATYAEGFRAGSFNVAAFTPEDFEFAPESSRTYEVGIKSELAEGLVRFNLGGFWTNYEDYQLAAFNGFGYIIANAEEVESKGVESDLTALLPFGLVANGSLGFNDARFVKQTRATCPTVSPNEPGGIPPEGPAALPPKRVCDLSGEPLFRAPRWTGSARLAWEQPLFQSLVGIVGGDANYKGAEFMDSDLDPLDRQGSYWLFNARVGVRTSNDRWRLDLHARNLSDELVKVFSGDVPVQAGAHWAHTNPPRTFFASLRFAY